MKYIYFTKFHYENEFLKFVYKFVKKDNFNVYIRCLLEMELK